MDKLNEMRIEDVQRAVNAARIFYDLFAETLNTVARSKPGAKEISKSQVLDVMYSYNMDCQNFPEDQASIFEATVKFLSQKTMLSEETIENVFNEVGEDPRILNVTSSNIELVSRIDSANKMVRLNVGEIGVSVPESVYARLYIKAGGDTSKISELIIKYFPLGITSGLFWSVDKPIYKELIEQSPLPALECFASPFNYSCSNFCSLFESDKAFGSKGNFFDYIQKLNEPCRLLVNPPYVEKIMAKTANVVLDYLNRVPGSEAIFMLPAWNKVGYGDKTEAIVTLENQHNIQSFEVPARQHTVYSFAKGESITANMALIFYILTSPGHTSSITMDRLKELIHEAYTRVGSKESVIKAVAPIQKKFLPSLSRVIPH